MRLDIYLTEKKLVPSRQKAKQLISRMAVLVNGNVVSKPSFIVCDDDNVIVSNESEILRYASFGGVKLEKAIKEFNIDIRDEILLDVGASTGGFTHCALEHGAKKSYCVDVGTEQLSETLKNDKRVINLEKTNILNLDFSKFKDISLVTIDVSFCSIFPIIDYIYSNVNNDTKFICLLKPQFEVGKAYISKGGIVKNDRVIDTIIKRFQNTLIDKEARDIEYTISPRKDEKLNKEFLFYFKK